MLVSNGPVRHWFWFFCIVLLSTANVTHYRMKYIHYIWLIKVRIILG